jgi:hypothetical protein
VGTFLYLLTRFRQLLTVTVLFIWLSILTFNNPNLPSSLGTAEIFCLPVVMVAIVVFLAAVTLCSLVCGYGYCGKICSPSSSTQFQKSKYKNPKLGIIQ